MLSAKFRAYGNKIILPIGKVFAKTGLPPNAITVLGLLAAATVGHMYRVHDLGLALMFLILTSFFDVLDGAVAREQGTVSNFGGFFDSVLDRYSDAIILIGMGMYLGDQYPLVLITLLGFFMVSYTRARAENIIEGKCDVGIAERAERLIIIIIATIAEMWGGLGPGTAFVYALVILAFFTHVTALQRIIYTYQMESS